MKYTLLISFILISGVCFGQTLKNYQTLSSSNRLIPVQYPVMTIASPPPRTVKTDSISFYVINPNDTALQWWRNGFKFPTASIIEVVIQDTCIKDTSEAYITQTACDSCKERLRVGYVVTNSCFPGQETFLDLKKQPLPERVTVIKYRRKNDNE